MKTIWKTLISLTVALSFCIGMGTMTFASESNDISLDDLLGLLSSLAVEEEGEETVEEVFEELTDEPVSGSESFAGVLFQVPDTFVKISEDDEIVMYCDSSFSHFLSISYFEAEEGEDFSLSSEANQHDLFESMTDGGSEISDYQLTTVDGHTALRVWYDQDIDSETPVKGNAIVIELENGLFAATLISLTDLESDGLELFEAFEGSIRINGSTASDGSKDSLFQSSNDPAPAAVPSGSAAQTPEDAIDASAVDEVVLLDDDICKVSLKNFTIPEDAWYGFSVKVYTENKSDQDLYFTTNYTTLNGYVIEPYWGETVAAGHKSNTEMTFYADEIEENGITNISELAFKLVVRDDNSYDTLESGYYTILPFGTDVPAQPEQEFPADAIVLVDNDILTLVVTGSPFSGTYYTEIPVYIENHTDKVISMSAYGSSAVNGYEISTYLYDDIPAGKKTNTTLYWSNDVLEENDIETIEEVELDLTVGDAEDWSVSPYYSELIYFEVN